MDGFVVDSCGCKFQNQLLDAPLSHQSVWIAQKEAISEFTSQNAGPQLHQEEMAVSGVVR